MTINIVSCLVLFPAVLWDLSTENSETWACIWNTMASSIVAHASLLAMLTIATDQYLAVVYPLEYSAKVTRGMSRKLIVGVWTLGALAATVASSQLMSAGDSSPWRSCRTMTGLLTSLQGSQQWLLCISALFFLVPVLILSGIYLRIFAAASKSSRDIRRNSFAYNQSMLNLNPALEDVIEDMEKEEAEEAKHIGKLLPDEKNRPTSASNIQEANSSIVAETKPKGKISKDEIAIDQEVVQKSNGGEDDVADEEVIMPAAALHQKRPPKLGSLKSQATFSKTIASSSGFDGHSEAKTTSPTAKLSTKPNLPRQMSHQDRRALMTPKRKCSFSSFSECRYVVDGGKTTTFLFSIETPSPSGCASEAEAATNAEGDEAVDESSKSLTPVIKRWKYGSSQAETSDTAWSSRDTERCSTSNGAIDITSNPMFAVGNGSDNVSRNSSPSPLPSPSRLKRRHESNVSGASEAEIKLPLSSEASNASLHKAGSLISMTSQVSRKRRRFSNEKLISFLPQAARRLSTNMSRRASSVYQFFQYKEELRTAKISAMVIVVAFLCWAPFFLNLALVTLLNNKEESLSSAKLIFWLHQASNLAMLGFAALSPYLYVFRSRKVQKCLGPVLTDTFCCFEASSTPPNSSRLKEGRSSWPTYRWYKAGGLLSSHHRRSLPTSNQEPATSGGGAGDQEAAGKHRHPIERERSSSCPNIEAERPSLHDMKSPEDANDLLFDKLLHQPPHVTLKPPAPVIAKRPSSNVDVYSAVIYEEDGELVPPDEDALSHRRLSTSLPFGLNLKNALIENSMTLESAV